MNEALLDLLPEVMSKVFNCSGFYHGSKSDFSCGMHDGNEGVQWNIDIIKSNNLVRNGVNLEGLKYENWPIARFLEYELKNYILYNTFLELKDKDIVITVLRDAWQVTARPSIEEKIIGGKIISIKDITKEKWIEILREAQMCLNIANGNIKRAFQEVTFLSGKKKIMQVSPHLYIYKVIPSELLVTKSKIIEAFFDSKNALEQIYKAISKEIIGL